MKKVILLSALVLALASCSTKSTTEEIVLAKDTATVMVDTTKAATATVVATPTVETTTVVAEPVK